MLIINPEWIEMRLGWKVDAAEAETFYAERAHVSLQRVKLRGGDAPPSIIVKHTCPPAAVSERGESLDPYEYVREYLAYETLPGLGAPTAKVFASWMEPDTQENVLVMEDLCLRGVIHPADHRFTPGEVESILNTYVALHAAGMRAAEKGALREQYPWLQDEGGKMGAEQAEWMVQALLASPLTGLRLAGGEGPLRTLAGRAGALRDHLAALPQTLTYNDFFPGNIAVPKEPAAGEMAVLFDWHLVGAGAPQSDLLNIFWNEYCEGADLDAYFGYYLEHFNAAVNARYDLAWVKEGLLLGELSGDLYQLWLLANELEVFEQDPWRLPCWMADSLQRVVDGTLEEKMRQYFKM